MTGGKSAHLSETKEQIEDVVCLAGLRACAFLCICIETIATTVIKHSLRTQSSLFIVSLPYSRLAIAKRRLFTAAAKSNINLRPFLFAIFTNDLVFENNIII